MYVQDIALPINSDKDKNQINTGQNYFNRRCLKAGIDTRQDLREEDKKQTEDMPGELFIMLILCLCIYVYEN